MNLSVSVRKRRRNQGPAKWFFVFAIAVLIGIGCTSPVTPSTTPGCPGACEQGSKLECEWATPQAECVAFCNAYHGVGYLKPWADCVGTATTVEHVAQCGMSCK